MTFSVTIQGNEITDIASFYRQLNEQLMQKEDWKLGESLDAFNNLLYGGFGEWKDADEREIVWDNIEKSKDVLGKQTTITYYQSKLYNGSSFNQKLIKQKVDELVQKIGQTCFEILMDIIEQHPSHVKLIAA